MRPGGVHQAWRDLGMRGCLTGRRRTWGGFCALDMAAIEELVARNVAIKAAVVGEDPHEKGVRAILNLGHTFGHAIENVCGYGEVLHGEAVGLGMIAAGRLAVALGKFSGGELQRVIDVIGKAGLPTKLPRLDGEKTYATMFTDKKVKGGKLRLILPVKIGHAEMVSDVPAEAIRAAIASLA